MTYTPIFAEGDVVLLRTAAGLWVIVELHLVRGEVTVARGMYGNGARRIVPVTDLLPVNTSDL